MAIYNITAGGQNVNAQNIQDVDLKPGNLTGYDLHYTEKGAGITTINTIAAGAVIGYSNQGGQLGIELGAPPTAGTYIMITGNGWPVDGSYYVNSVSGNIALTTYPYYSCFAAGGGNAAVCSGQLYSGNEDSVNIFAENGCRVPTGETKSHASTGNFTSYAYTDCWQCFSGQLNPCDVTVNTFQWWSDDFLTVDRAVTTEGSKVYATANAVPGDNNPSGQNG